MASAAERGNFFRRLSVPRAATAAVAIAVGSIAYGDGQAKWDRGLQEIRALDNSLNLSSAEVERLKEPVIDGRVLAAGQMVGSIMLTGAAVGCAVFIGRRREGTAVKEEPAGVPEIVG